MTAASAPGQQSCFPAPAAEWERINKFDPRGAGPDQPQSGTSSAACQNRTENGTETSSAARILERRPLDLARTYAVPESQDAVNVLACALLDLAEATRGVEFSGQPGAEGSALRLSEMLRRLA